VGAGVSVTAGDPDAAGEPDAPDAAGVTVVAVLSSSPQAARATAARVAAARRSRYFNFVSSMDYRC
jgi:hypothetical protein